MQQSPQLYFVLIMHEQDLTPPSLGPGPYLIRSATSFCHHQSLEMHFDILCFLFSHSFISH